MADKIIAATIQVNTGNSNANIKDLNQELSNVKQGLNSTGAAATKTGKEIDGSTGNFGNLKNTLTSMPGPLGGVIDGVGKVSGALKALLLNPVGLFFLLIVGALSALYKAFINSFEGGQKMQQVFGGIRSAGQALVDNIEKISGAIDKAFDFDFSGAIADIKGVANEAGKAFDKMAKLVAEKQKLDLEQAQGDFEAIERQAKLSDLKDKQQDKEKFSAAERKKFGTDLLKESEENAKGDIDLAKRVADNAVNALLVQEDGARKNAIEILRIRGEQKQDEISNLNELKNIKKINNSVDKEIDADAKAIHDATMARAKEAAAKNKEIADEKAKQIANELKLQKELNSEFAKLKTKELEDTQVFIEAENKIQNAKDAAEIKRIEDNEKNRLQTKVKLAELELVNSPDSATAKIDKINADLELELTTLAAGDLKRQTLAQKASNEIIAIKQTEAEAKKQIDELEFQNKLANAEAIGGVATGLSELIGKETAVGKAAAVAGATIDTYSAASKIFRQAADNPITKLNPAYPFLMAIPAVLGGLARVKQILAVKVPGGGGSGGGGSTPSISIPSAPIAPKTGTTTLDQTSINNMGNAAQPVRAYMVDTDATNNRERNERLNRAARIGG